MGYIDALKNEMQRYCRQNIFLSLALICAEDKKAVDEGAELLRKNYRIVDHIEKICDDKIFILMPLTDLDGAKAAVRRAENFVFSPIKVQVDDLFNNEIDYELKEEDYEAVLSGEYDFNAVDCQKAFNLLLAFAKEYKKRHTAEQDGRLINKGVMPEVDFKSFLDFEIKRCLRYNFIFTLFVIKEINEAEKILSRINDKIQFGDIFGVFEKNYVFLIYYNCDHYKAKEVKEELKKLLNLADGKLSCASFPKDGITKEEILEKTMTN